MQTQGAIGNLINRYRAVLNKCRLLNVFGSLAVAGLLVMGGAGMAGAVVELKENTTITNDHTTFIGQSGRMGGAIVAGSNITLTLDDVYFISNYSTDSASRYGKGGAIFTGNTHVTIKNSYFENNYTLSSVDTTGEVNGGGALWFGTTLTSAIIENTKFYYNKQNPDTTFPSDKHDGGGAIYAGSESEIIIRGGEFVGNTAAAKGGAIKADGILTIEADALGNKTVFKDNKAIGEGGAISISNTATAISISDAEFTGNKAGGEGGAIFYRPTAATNPTLTFTGNNVFSGNYADWKVDPNTGIGTGTSNDIYSTDNLIVADSGDPNNPTTLDLQSGYKQAQGIDPDSGNLDATPPALTVDANAQMAAKSITLGDEDANKGQLSGGTVTVNQGGALGNGTDIAGLQAAIKAANDNGVDTMQGTYVGKTSLDLANAGLGVGTNAGSPQTATFAPGSALLVDQKALEENGGAPAFTGLTSATMEDKSSLFVQNAVAGKTLTVFADANNTALTEESGALSIADTVNLKTDNSMVTLSLTDLKNGTVETKAANVSSVLPGLSPELGALVTANAFNMSNQPGAEFLRRLTADDGMRNDPKGAVTTLESAARVAAIAGVPQMTWAAQKAANAAVTQRTSLAAPASAGLQAVAADGSVQTGAAAGDAMKNGFAMWIMPLYQSWNAWGMEGGNLDMDVNGALGGLAVGADYTFADAFRAGITVNMGGGYAEGSGDFNKTTNDFTFWGLGAYLGWSKDNFGLTADINHTWVYNDVEQDLSASMRMDTLKSDITSRALSAGLRGEYKLATDALDITPHVGVRYTYLTTDKYDVESGNANVVEGDAIHQGIWTFPIGVAFSKDVQMDSGWYVKPSLDVAVIPAAGDIKARGNINFTGVPGSAELSTQTMDYITYMGQAGLEFGNDNVKLGVNYNLQMGAQSTAHGVFGTLRYEF